MTTQQTKLEQLIAAAKKRKLEADIAKQEEEATFLAKHRTPASMADAVQAAKSPLFIGTDGMNYNRRQTDAIELALTGDSFCLIGAAGTGKTTCVREMCKQLVLQDKVPLLRSSTKQLFIGTPGVVCVSFTNVAVINIDRNMQGAVPCKTIHSLLEFMPVNYEVIEDDGNVRNTMRFEPARHRHNPLPSELTTIIVEEASMVGTELFSLLLDALPNIARVQFIILGDINQLPPVYDTAILGYKMLELPIIELTEVYRQALESPILALAHNVKNGITMCEAELRSAKGMIDKSETGQGKLTIKPWKKSLDSFDACNLAAAFTKAAIDVNEFDPDRDMCLIPFNKDFGTIEFNKAIAQHLGEKREAIVYEVIAGFNKYYIAEGDRVLVNKKFGVIKKVVKNGSYGGISVQEPSLHLNRWGYNTEHHAKKVEAAAMGDIDSILAAIEDVDDRKNQASHLIEVLLEGDEDNVTLTTSAEVNGMLFSYALTVHKAQGSEWRKVYCFFHKKHNGMMSRELLYTAITRAREELVIVCEPNHFIKAVNSQRIKGDTLAEKAEYFKGKQEENEANETN